MPRFHHTLEPHATKFAPVLDYLRKYFSVLVNETRIPVNGNVLAELYGNVYSICSQGGTQQEFPEGEKWCYTQYQMLVSGIIRDTVFPTLHDAYTQSSEAFLTTYVKLWTNFKTFVKSIVFVFDYLGKWTLNSTHYTLEIRAYELWATELFDPACQAMVSQLNKIPVKNQNGTQPKTPLVNHTHQPINRSRMNQVSDPNEYYYNFCPVYRLPGFLKPAIPECFDFGDEYTEGSELDDDYVLSQQWEKAPHMDIPIKDAVIAAFLELCAKDRAGEPVNKTLLKETAHSFTDLGLGSAYEAANQTYVFYFYKFLESKALRQIQDFYQIDIDVESLGFGEYVTKLGTIFATEQNRVQSYFHLSTIDPLKHKLHEIVLKNTLADILAKESAMAFYFNESNVQITTTLFDMLSVEEDTLKIFSTRLQEYVQEVGSKLIKRYNDQLQLATQSAQNPQPGAQKIKKPDPVTLVEDLIKTDTSFRHIVDSACRSDPTVFAALRQASESFINQQETLISSTLAQYSHSLLSSRSKRQAAVSSLPTQLASIAHLFKYLRNKDYFEQEYLVKLSNRLLSGASLGQKNEQDALRGLIAESGSEFSHKASGLQTDLGLSKDFTAVFKHDRAELLARFGVDVNFFVCTSNSGWVLPQTQYSVSYTLQSGLHTPEPHDKNADKPSNDFMKLPEVFREVWAQFGHFYCQQHERRILEYRLDEGSCEVSYVPDPEKNPQNVYIFVVTPIMAVILMYLGSQPKFVLWKDLVAALGLEPALLAEHLFPLCLPLDQPTKCIVRKSTPTPTFNDTDKLLLSKNYESNVVKKTIDYVRKETQKDIQKRDMDLNAVRLLSAQAVITRLLKMRKSATYNEIIQEASEQLSSRFTPSIELLKQAIESLVDKEILERDPEDRNKYLYLA